MNRIAGHSRFFWPLQICGWLIYGGIGMAINVRFYGGFSGNLLAVVVADLAMLIGGTWGIREWSKRYEWSKLPLVRLVGRIGVSTFILAVGSRLILSVVILWVFPVMKVADYKFAGLAIVVFQVEVILLLWAFMYFGFNAFRNYKQEEVEKWRLHAAVKDAELIALKSQINPHFIFNCLNNIRGLVLEDGDRARAAITQLSDLLRYSIRYVQAEKVSLANELEIVRDYLELERIQAEDRLRTEFEVDESLLGTEVPPMSIQLLVENAIKYGISQSPEGGLVKVAAREERGKLVVEILNTGQLKGAADGSTGIGLKNARERLELLFGDGAKLVLENANDEEVSARFEVPLQNR